MAVSFWGNSEIREPLKSLHSLISILRVLPGPHSQGVENKTNTAELNQDGD